MYMTYTSCVRIKSGILRCIFLFLKLLNKKNAYVIIFLYSEEKGWEKNWKF